MVMSNPDEETIASGRRREISDRRELRVENPPPPPHFLLLGPPPPLWLDFRERGGGGGGGGGGGEGCTAIVDALRRDGVVDGCCARWGERRQQRGDDEE